MNEIPFKEINELNLPEFYKELNNAINTNQAQTVYQLSKIFNQYCFKNLDFSEILG